jgi:hypothetical protein
MKVIGLMITKDEEWIIESSLRVLSKFVDEIIILDDSSDTTVDKIRKLQIDDDEIYLYFQREFPKLKCYCDYRQKLLEIGRKHDGTHFVVLDADEMFPEYAMYDFRDDIKKLEPGVAYQYEVMDFYGSPFEYVPGGNIGPNLIDAVFCDDGEMQYDYLPIHEKRTPVKRYQRHYGYPLLHYGYLSLIKMYRKRTYYKLMEYINNVSSVPAINWKYRLWGLDRKIRQAPSGWYHDDVVEYYELIQDNGEHFQHKIEEIFKKYSGDENLSGIDYWDTFSWYRLLKERVVDLLRNNDKKMLIRSVKDYIFLDVVKKW